jgi:hypothetical protein
MLGRMDLQNHPFRTGCIIGLIWGAIAHPWALGCYLLILLGVALVLGLAVVLVFLDWMPWSLLLAIGVVAAIMWGRRQAR